METSHDRHLRLLADFARVLSESRGLKDISAHVVRLVSDHLGGDRCHLYLVEPGGGSLVLAATSSVHPQPQEVRLEMGEGLTGMVAQTMESLNVANGPRTPGFREFSGMDETGLVSYLGVPLVARGRCNGVLVVRNGREAIQPADNEALIVAVASQLSGIVDSARLLEALENRVPDREHRLALLDHPTGVIAPQAVDRTAEMIMFRGFAAAPGLAQGPVFRHGRRHARADLEALPHRDEAEDQAAFGWAVEEGLEEIRRSEAVAVDLVGQELSYVFGAQALLLNDPAFQGSVRGLIAKGSPAALAVNDAVEALMDAMKQARSEYLRERAEDFADIGRMLVGKLIGDSTPSRDPSASVVFSQALSPGDLILLASRGARAFVTSEGGVTSHVSLMARALNLPAITGVGNILKDIPDGAPVLVDAVVGNVFVHPTRSVQEEYRKVAEIEAARVEVGVDREALGPCRLASGESVLVMANVGLLRELPVASTRGADGVGLYRTEFPYLVRRDAPTEAQQHQVYQRAFEEFGDGPITFRTLDLGGDKMAPFLQGGDEVRDQEENPFLGQRSIRLSLANPELFRTQLRALLRACDGHRGRILFPMISAVEEMREVLRQVDLARAELRSRGTHFQEDVPVGAMIEVPAAVEVVEHLAKLVDFLSVGTNDLLQYTVAADRGNRNVAYLASNYHPALLSMLSRLAWESTKAGVQLSVCGEMAADPASVLFLAGIQVDVLSMDSRYVPRTKALLRGYGLQELKEIAGGVRKLSTASEVNRYLNQRVRLPQDAGRLLEPRN